jgi:DNA-binding XRE family transcriptional regulator
MSEVFNELKRIIIRSGMSAWNVAHKAGCSEATINNWMTGRVTEPHLPTLLAVAKVFGKSVELIDGELRIAPEASKPREFVGYWRRYQ